MFFVILLQNRCSVGIGSLNLFSSAQQPVGTESELEVLSGQSLLEKK